MYLCGIDVGTTTIKSSVFDERGRLLKTYSEGYPLITSPGGGVEQDARSWYDLSAATMKKCMSELPATDKAYLSISAQGGSVVPVDENGEPLALAATWMDGRGEEFITELCTKYSRDEFFKKTGKRPGKTSGLTKIKLFEHLNPAAYLTTLEYVNMRLTGRAVTDPTSAEMVALYDINNGGWQREILDVCGIDINKLPEIAPSGEIIGKLTPEAVSDSGLPEETYVVNGAHDQYIAAAGANVLSHGDVLLSTGTAWVVFGSAEKRNLNSSLSIGPHVIPDMFGVFSSVPTGGAALDWVRGKILSDVDFETLDGEVMERIGKNKNLMCVPRFSGQEAVISGLELSTDGYDIALAVMEGVVFEVRTIFERFMADGYLPAKDISVFRDGKKLLGMVGGAVKGKPWQTLVGAILGDTAIYRDSNMTLIGTAVFAGVAAGIWKNYAEGSDAICDPVPLTSGAELRTFYDEKFESYKNRLKK